MKWFLNLFKKNRQTKLYTANSERDPHIKDEAYSSERSSLNYKEARDTPAGQQFEAMTSNRNRRPNNSQDSTIVNTSILSSSLSASSNDCSPSSYSSSSDSGSSSSCD